MNKFEWHRAFTASGLGLSVIAVGARVWDYTDADCGNAHPGVSVLARDLKISRSTVIRHLDTLRESGWLVRSSTANSNPHRDWSDIYALAIPSLATDTRSTEPSSSRDTRSTEPSVISETRSEGPSVTSETRSTADRVPSVTDRVPLVNRPSSICARPGSTSDTPTDLLTTDLGSDPETTDTAPRTRRETEEIGFSEFWHCYPRREGKGAAKKAYVKALGLTDHETIIAAAKRFAADPNRVPQFTAHPTTWLNQGRWEDEALPDRALPGGTSATDKVAGWAAIAGEATVTRRIRETSEIAARLAAEERAAEQRDTVIDAEIEPAHVGPAIEMRPIGRRPDAAEDDPVMWFRHTNLVPTDIECDRFAELVAGGMSKFRARASVESERRASSHA